MNHRRVVFLLLGPLGGQMNLDILSESANHRGIDLVGLLEPSVSLGEVSDLSWVDDGDIQSGVLCHVGHQEMVTRSGLTQEECPAGLIDTIDQLGLDTLNVVVDLSC